MISIQLPSSKSISNRALIIQALCSAPIQLHHLSEANDTQLLKRILTDHQQIAYVNAEDAGTTFRFLLAYYASLEACSITLGGSHRMEERPIGDLVEALRTLGARIEYQRNEGYPPLHILGTRLQGDFITLPGNISSQFISALCLIAPRLNNRLQIDLIGDLVSKPYIQMTLDLMKHFGIHSKFQNNSITIQQGDYQSSELTIEADWSAAAFFYVAQRLNPKCTLFLKGLQKESVQGDASVANVAVSFGVHTSFQAEGVLLSASQTDLHLPLTIDITDHPDMAIPFIVLAAMAYPELKFIGVQHLAFKESNRLEALKTELHKAGCFMFYDQNTIWFEEARLQAQSINFKSYQDHRIVMALNLFSLIGYQVSFDHPECVKKSFPGYWEEFGKLHNYSIHLRKF